MLFQKKKNRMLAVASGTAVPLSEVPDQAFSTELLGKGFAIEPSDGMIYSPITGRLHGISDARHAYTIFSEDGLDVLVHIGIDSVSLKGEGFFPLCEEGAAISAGDALARVDLDQLRRNGLPTVIPVVVTNPERLTDVDLSFGPTQGGKSDVMHYRIASADSKKE